MDLFDAIPFLMIAMWLGIAAYNIRHGGSMWFYKWYSREEAPLKFWLSIIAYLACTLSLSWMMFSGAGWRIKL